MTSSEGTGEATRTSDAPEPRTGRWRSRLIGVGLALAVAALVFATRAGAITLGVAWILDPLRAALDADADRDPEEAHVLVAHGDRRHVLDAVHAWAHGLDDEVTLTETTRRAGRRTLDTRHDLEVRTPDGLLHVRLTDGETPGTVRVALLSVPDGPPAASLAFSADALRRALEAAGVGTR